MGDSISQMLEEVAKELAGHGVSMETLTGQAQGKLPMNAPDGIALLATVFPPEYAVWFFEFLKGYVSAPAEEQADEMPDPSKLAPLMATAFASLPLSEAERQELIDSILKPYEQAGGTAPADEAGAEPGQPPEEAVADLQKKADELQNELDKKLADLKAKGGEPPAEAPAAEAPTAEAPEPTQQAVDQLQQAIENMQKSLEEQLGKLQPPPA
jgi:hypothetical protein